MECRKRMIRKISPFAAAVVFLWSFSSDLFYAQTAYGYAAEGGEMDPGAAFSDATPDVAELSPGNVTVNFRDVDVNTVLHYLSEVSGVDIIPHPDIRGKVTMRLRDKSWLDALEIVTRNYGYVYSMESGIIRVMPRGQLEKEEPVTEVIRLNNLTMETELTKGAASSGGGGALAALSGGDTGGSKSSTGEVRVEQKEESIGKLIKAINAILDRKRGEDATYIPSVNAIVVTAIPTKMSRIRNIVESIDRRPAQIVLDAKVVEITLNKDERFGVDWNAVMSAAGARRPITFPFTSEGLLTFLPGQMQRQFIPKFGPAGTQQDSRFPYMEDTLTASLFDPVAAPVDGSLYSLGTLDFSTFNATLRLIDQRGDAEILSSPRITTLNNRKATIKVIEKVMLQRSVQTTQVSSLVTVEFEDEKDAREVGVKLAVIPHVNDRGEISVNLLPEVSSDIAFTEVSAVAGNTVALTYSSREANTVVRVNDGETIFLGGLIRRNVETTENKFPVLGDIFGGIPVLGNVFKYDAENITRTEVVFFVTVHIVKDTMDSVLFMDAEEHYDKHITREGRDKFGDRVESPEGESSFFLKRGQWNTSEKTEVIESVKQPAEEEKKKGAFIDFRKK
ncbi:MAG: secretin and TonB N-terminal domain-containing protein [Candidatus Omnitrophota bacterium]